MTRTIIKDAYIRHYGDNGQTTGYVEWSDGSRTEGNPRGLHMEALFARFRRETGRKVRRETW